jgi:HAD superfamily hydrolase (TIGR01549 family)
MKQRLRKKLQEYRLIIFDMDGTLYYQFPLRLCMCVELIGYYILHIYKITELLTLSKFRKLYEKGILGKGNTVVTHWMQERPLRYIALFQDKKLLHLIRSLQEQGVKIAVYSDYPVEQKIRVLHDLAIDHYFCASDTVIHCLKPDPRGLKNIVRITGESIENSLFIGDRYEKDGKCAENAGMDYIILDKNPLSRNISLHRKELFRIC